jgi:small subunit ribosomal protein S1
MASTATSYNPSRDDFAAMLDESFAGGNLQESSVIKGKVVAIEKDMAVIDVGLKTEGRVALREFNGPGRENDLKVGDEVEVFLDRIENALGEAVLSRDKARREESWGKLEKAFNANEKVTGVIFNQVKGGFTVDLDGAVAFLPRSQVDIRPIRDVAPLMNNAQPFQILKMDRRRGNIVVSRRTVLEETRAEQRQELVQNLEEGQVIDGVVKNITDYGAFVDLGGIDGLLHVTDIAWRRVNHPTEVLAIGQTVKVKIIKINHDTHRISLGMKQLLDDPWQGIEAKYPLNSRFTGRVTNITDYGAFVELEPGIEGLIHVSEMSWTKKNMHPGKIVSTSQEVEVQVLEVDRPSAASRSVSSRPCAIRGKCSSKIPGRRDRGRRSQEQDRVRIVPGPRRRRRRHGASVRPRLETAGRAGHRQLQEGRHGQGRGARRGCREGAHLARREAARGRSVRRTRRRQEGRRRDLRNPRGKGSRYRSSDHRHRLHHLHQAF